VIFPDRVQVRFYDPHGTVFVAWQNGDRNKSALILEAMKGNFNSIIQSNVPVLVDFHATWCAPCKTQSPILVEISRELDGKLKVIKIDVDKNPELANRYQIRSVPTLALFRNGQQLWRQSRLVDKAGLQHILQHYI
jgi:thioredoxin 1